MSARKKRSYVFVTSSWMLLPHSTAKKPATQPAYLSGRRLYTGLNLRCSFRTIWTVCAPQWVMWIMSVVNIRHDSDNGKLLFAELAHLLCTSAGIGSGILLVRWLCVSAFLIVNCWTVVRPLVLQWFFVSAWQFLPSLVVAWSLSRVHLFATAQTTACQASLSFTISWSLLKLLPIESVMPSKNHFILCHPLLLLSSIFRSIRVFSNESALHIRWPKYWSFSISPSNEYSELISFRIDCLISLQSKGLSTVFSSTTVQKHQFFCTQLSW